MHIITNRLEITVPTPVHDQRLVAPAEQVPEQFVPPIAPRRVGALKRFHARDQIPLRCLNHQMKMLWRSAAIHQAFQ